MKLELHERKNTTEDGLNELETLIKSFDFDDDITTVESDTFFCEGDIGGSQDYVWSDTGKWVVKDGVLSLECSCELQYSDSFVIVNIENLQKINFVRALEELNSVITRYNENVKDKDAQIQKFLNFCKQYNN